MSKKNLKKASTKTVEERASLCLKSLDKLLSQSNLIMRPIISFPKRKKVPFLSRLAIKTFSKQGGILDLQFLDNVKK